MWREYTRETPARPGLAIVMAAVALLGTTALAWMITQRVNPQTMRSLDYWPIRFSLPERFILAFKEHENILSEWIDGSRDAAIFLTDGRSELAAEVAVVYQIFGESDDLDDVAFELLDESVADATPIPMGPVEGRLIKLLTRDEIIRLIAVGMTPGGLAILVEYRTAHYSEVDFARFQKICESIQFQDWSVPPPPWKAASRKGLL